MNRRPHRTGGSSVFLFRTGTVDLVLALGQLPPFSELSPEELLGVTRIAERRVVEADEVLFLEGDEADGLYVVSKGELVVERTGRELARLRRGEIVGELSVLDGEPRSATVRGAERTELYFVGREDFLDLCDASPALVQSLLLSLASRLSGVE
jgi:CRP/FNR family transcriptional regulator/CRP/FNR family cyclic AMP-dependent transcriptional regulator